MKRFLLSSFLLAVALQAFPQASVPFTSSNLPIIIIDTNGKEIVDDPKIEASLGIIYNGVNMRNNVTDPHNNYSGLMGIEIRGSSSQQFPKKQYGVQLQDVNGDDVEASLLGLPKEEDWIFSAPYNDKTLMRDVLAYKLANDLGEYAPRTKFVELQLNGSYNGIYVLTEKIKRDKNRVNIEKLDPEETAPADISGGYIIKVDKTTGDSGEGWFSPHLPLNSAGFQQTLFQYEYPKYDEIVAEQKQYIQNYVGQFESALKGDAFKDPATGYAKYINVNTFIDYFLMQEVTRNVDGYRLSAFFHKDIESKGGKLSMGPVWDFNLGFGNANYCDGYKTDGFAMNFNSICSEDGWLIPFWWKRFFEDPAFAEQTAARWATVRQDKFKTSTIHQYIDSVAAVLSVESRQRNFQRWPNLGKYEWPNQFVGNTYEEEITYLKQWVSNRLAWLDVNIPKLKTNAITDIVEPVAESRVSVYPNPFTKSVTLQYTIAKPGLTEIEIYNAQGGQLNITSVQHADAGEKTFTRDLEAAGGMYYYIVRHDQLVIGRGKLMRK